MALHLSNFLPSLHVISIKPFDSLAIQILATVSPSSTQFREISSEYLEFAIIIACKPYAKPESGANLVLV
jgi:hypothetical protein